MKFQGVRELGLCLALVLASALFASWWYFSPLLGVLLSDRPLSTAPVEDLGLILLLGLMSNHLSTDNDSAVGHIRQLNPNNSWCL